MLFSRATKPRHGSDKNASDRRSHHWTAIASRNLGSCLVVCGFIRAEAGVVGAPTSGQLAFFAVDLAVLGYARTRLFLLLLFVF